MEKPPNKNRSNGEGKMSKEYPWSYDEREPECPHCGKRQTDLWELHLGDGDDAVINCQHCDQELDVVCTVTVEYSVRQRGEAQE